MIDTIIDSLASSIKSSLSWSESCYGLVTTMETADKDNKQIRFPVYLLKNGESCITGEYVNLIPDSTKRSVIYFELDSNKITNTSDNGFLEMEANVTLVCWFNYKLIDEDLRSSDILFADLIASIPKRLSSDKTVLVTIDNSETNDGNVFSKYDYKTGMQYFKYPYGYFTVGLNILYRVFPKCVTVNNNPSDCASMIEGFDYSLDLTF